MFSFHAATWTDSALRRSAATWSVVTLSRRGSGARTHFGVLLPWLMTMHSVSNTVVFDPFEKCELVFTTRVAWSRTSFTWLVLTSRTLAGPDETWVMFRSSGVFLDRSTTTVGSRMVRTRANRPRPMRTTPDALRMFTLPRQIHVSSVLMGTVQVIAATRTLHGAYKRGDLRHLGLRRSTAKIISPWINFLSGCGRGERAATFPLVGSEVMTDASGEEPDDSSTRPESVRAASARWLTQRRVFGAIVVAQTLWLAI